MITKKPALFITVRADCFLVTEFIEIKGLLLLAEVQDLKFIEIRLELDAKC